MRGVLLGLGLLSLAACGVSETAVTTAAGAAAKAQEAEAAKGTTERVEAQLDAAAQLSQQRLQEAEAAAK